MTQHADQEFMNCPVCFIWWSAPEALFAARRKDGKDFFCPNGHQLSWSDNENDRIRRERDRLKQENARIEERRLAAERAEAWQRGQREAAERRASAARGQVTRLKNRAANGVCPCCSRTFVNLQRHMASKHAGFLVEEVQAEVGKAIN